MEPFIKKWILDLIEETEVSCQSAIEPENLKSRGYPYAAGLSLSTLKIIKGTVEGYQ